ncbi:hypothetical protein C1645_256350 [Glomus cerebriforme]|uniref:Uncharacterized protein n=1 Tax=Glomus cerebriforme TaxID=658196 RepID=A0A397SZC9_9GLOM|nr:hypothetical protein C1645_256350 [Glomus cerebriforme]
MSQKILLDRTESSNRLHVLALDRKTQSYLSIRISSPEEIIKRYCKGILNAYMLFMIDFQTAFKAAKKSNKKFRNKTISFKNPLLFWGTSPNEVRDEYSRIFDKYKKLKPKGRDFIPFCPQENASKNYNKTEFENLEGQDSLPNNTDNVISQPKAIENFEVTLGQDNSSSNFLQSEPIQYSSGNTDNIVDTQENFHLSMHNLPNNTHNLIFQQAIQFENFTLDQNNYINNFTPQSQAIQYPSSENVYLAEDNGNLFYSETTLDQNNYTNDFILQPEIYSSVDFKNGNLLRLGKEDFIYFLCSRYTNLC